MDEDTATIELENVGPIDEFRYEMTEPGLHVIRGEQGVGKTTILRTVQLAQGTPLDRDVKPTVKDGKRKAVAEVGGKTLKIAKSVRTEGDCGFDGLGDLDVSTVAWPNLKTADKRDAHRIAALCSLAGVKPDKAAFKSLCDECSVLDEDWDEIVFDADVTDDIVATAGSFKRAIERRALAAEKTASGAEAEVEKLEGQIDGVDPDAETDAATLQAAVDAAVEGKQAITARMKDAESQANAVADAESRIAQLQSEYTGPDRETAEKSLIAETETLQQKQDRVDQLLRELQAAEADRDGQEAVVAEARHARELAEVHFDRVDELQAVISADAVAIPTPEEMAKAETAYRSAMDALQAGERAREAAKIADRINDLKQIAKQQGKRGRRLRDAAAAVAGVLTTAIQTIDGCPLKVVSDDKGVTRLAIATDRNEAELFDELSDGERWRVIAETVFRAGRLVVLPQAAMGELSPPTRDSVDQLAAERGCNVVTAIADAGPLRAHRWGTADPWMVGKQDT